MKALTRLFPPRIRLRPRGGPFTVVLGLCLLGFEVFGRQAASDVYDGLAGLALVAVGLLVAIRHQRMPLPWISRLGGWLRRAGRWLAELRYEHGIDLRGSPPSPAKRPRSSATSYWDSVSGRSLQSGRGRPLPARLARRGHPRLLYRLPGPAAGAVGRLAGRDLRRRLHPYQRPRPVASRVVGRDRPPRGGRGRRGGVHRGRVPDRLAGAAVRDPGDVSVGRGGRGLRLPPRRRGRGRRPVAAAFRRRRLQPSPSAACWRP